MPTADCPACGVKPGFGRPPSLPPRSTKLPHAAWWKVCGCGGMAHPVARAMTYRAVIDDWNRKIGLPEQRPRLPGLGKRLPPRDPSKPSWSGEPAHVSKYHRR